MENEAIIWHKYKDTHMAVKGDRVLALVEPGQDFPCEVMTILPLQGVFITLEAAKKEVEEGHARYLRNTAEADAPPKNLYLDILRQFVKSLEEKEAVKA